MNNETNYLKGIAGTIRNQIRATDPMALMAWGAREFIFGRMGEDNYPALKFKVSGLKFKGYVMVLYNEGMDTYEVATFKIRKGEVKYQDHIKDVYCDTLMETIDRLIER